MYYNVDIFQSGGDVCTGDKIFFHSAPQGSKLDYMRNDDRVCFEMSEMLDIVPNPDPCRFSTRYRSVQVFGRAEIVEDEGQKASALRLLVEKFAPGTGDLVKNPAGTGGVAVIALHNRRISGRANF